LCRQIKCWYNCNKDKCAHKVLKTTLREEKTTRKAQRNKLRCSGYGCRRILKCRNWSRSVEDAVPGGVKRPQLKWGCSAAAAAAVTVIVVLVLVAVSAAAVVVD
jgi:hypothetical protein